LVPSPLALALVKLVVEAVLLIVAILLAVKIINLLTKGFDEWKEVHKGNVAVAIYMAGMIISVGFIVQPGIEYFLDSLSLDLAGMQAGQVLIAIQVGIVQLFVAFVVAIVVQFMALEMLKHIHRLMAAYNEWDEMQKGNVAAGIIMGVTLALIGILLSSAMRSILDLVRAGSAEGLIRATLTLISFLTSSSWIHAFRTYSFGH
jgi:uncharacterized membrane protein YjfL (UPF0719 family)